MGYLHDARAGRDGSIAPHGPQLHRRAPLAVCLALVCPGAAPSANGVWLAVLSGAITSALGYVVWYAVLPRLTAAAAGAAQLLVPIVTALVGVSWLGEQPSVALIGSSALILGGVSLVMGFSGRPTRALILKMNA
jgi:drug/metabolite transporter (DMT)-like permease